MSEAVKKPIELDLTPSGAKEKAQKALEGPKPETLVPVPREMNINLSYTDPDGFKHTAVVVSRVMTGSSKTLCDLTAMNLAGGQPLQNLPPGLQMRYLAMARLEVQLAECPKWLSKWASEDDVLLMSIFDHLEAHNLRYFRRSSDSGEATEVSSWLRVNSEAIDVTD